MVRSRFSRILVVLLVALFPLSALAGNEVGKMKGNGSGLDWPVTRNDHDMVILTVMAPDGTVYAKEFQGGQTPSFRSNDLKKDGSVDGTYSYELRLVPKISGQVKAALNAARAKGDDAEIEKIMQSNGLDQQVVQSGSFGVLGGVFLDPDAVEPDANDAAADRRAITTDARPGDVAVNDQVIPDDLIVTGSACVGFDCVDGESFGFDTIRMKENNVQINFTDTSTSAGFPANDWTIVANDSTSGGANYLAFNDVTAARKTFLVEAAAPANSLYVDSTGNIGFQQSAPALDLHLTTTDTPALRLEQTNGGGFTAQTWDIGGNEANFFVRDLTGGSRLSFRIRPGAPTSSIDISASGNVGFGNASPGSFKMDVAIPTGTSNNGVRIFDDGATADPGIEFLPSPTGSNRILSFDRTANAYKALAVEHGTGGLTTTFHSSGNVGFNVSGPIHPIQHSSGAHLTSGGTWTNSSSRELKQDITALDTETAVHTLESLQPVTYSYKVTPQDGQVGFIAEDVPALVATPDRKGLAPMEIVAVLTQVVKQQQKTIENLQERLDQIEKTAKDQ